MGRKVVVLTIDQKREIYNYKKKYPFSTFPQIAKFFTCKFNVPRLTPQRIHNICKDKGFENISQGLKGQRKRDKAKLSFERELYEIVVQIAPQLPISSESSPIRKQRKISHFFVSKKSKKSDTKSGQSGEPRTKLPVKPISSTNFEPIDYSAPSNQSIYETVDVAHSSNFLGMLNECGIPPSYANDQEIEDREIELELETSRESLKSFTLLN